MDLTVEIHGDAGSLEECLEQFTAKEWLHGDNMYKCDGYGCFPSSLILYALSIICRPVEAFPRLIIPLHFADVMTM